MAARTPMSKEHLLFNCQWWTYLEPDRCSFQANLHCPKHEHTLIVHCAGDKAANACYWHAEDGSRWILCQVHARTCDLHAVVRFVSVCDRDVDC